MKWLKDTIATSEWLTSLKMVKQFQIIGSSLIDPDTANDLDFLVLADAKGFMEVQARINDMGFEHWAIVPGQYADQNEDWGSLRSGDVNLIVTIDPEWYKRAALANELTVALKLTDKGDRIVAYRVIRDGYSAEAANLRRDGK